MPYSTKISFKYTDKLFLRDGVCTKAIMLAKP